MLPTACGVFCHNRKLILIRFFALSDAMRTPKKENSMANALIKNITDASFEADVLKSDLPVTTTVGMEPTVDS